MAWKTESIVTPLTEMGEVWMRTGFRVDEYQVFHFAHVKVEMPMKYLSGDLTLAAGYVSLGLR